MHRHGVVDGGLDRPPALSGVLGVAADLVEVGVVLQRGDEQVQQPGADHGALAPGVEHLGDVLDDVHLLEELPALGVGLHHGVLDAVVDHLGEVTRACPLAGVDHPGLALGLERLEGRQHLLDVLVAAAVHQGIAVLEAPDAAGDAAVDETDALLLEHRGVGLVVGPARVAAVDDEVTLAEQSAELLDGLPGRVAGRHHHPDHLRSVLGQLGDQVGEALGVAQVLVAVVAHDRVPGVAQTGAHVATHLPEADESEVHERCSLRWHVSSTWWRPSRCDGRWSCLRQ